MMGTMLNLALGYGILLKKKDRDKWKDDVIFQKLENYFQRNIEIALSEKKAVKSTGKEGTKPGSDVPGKCPRCGGPNITTSRGRWYCCNCTNEWPDFASASNLADTISDETKRLICKMECDRLFDLQASKKSGKPVFKDGMLFSDVFLFPREEGGPGSFLGYVVQKRRGDPIDVECWFGAMGKKFFDRFEIPSKIIEDDEATMEVDLDGKKAWIPSDRSIVGTMMLKDAGMKWDGTDQSEAFRKVSCATKEECIGKVKETIKKKWVDVSCVYYNRALDMVRIFYPSTEFKDIEQYLVGWWN